MFSAHQYTVSLHNNNITQSFLAHDTKPLINSFYMIALCSIRFSLVHEYTNIQVMLYSLYLIQKSIFHYFNVTATAIEPTYDPYKIFDIKTSFKLHYNVNSIPCHPTSLHPPYPGGDIGEFTSQEVIVSDQTVNVGEAGYLFCGGIGNPAPLTKFVTVSPTLPGVLGPTTR